MNGHILLAYECDGKGGGVPWNGEPVDGSPERDRWTWVHLDANHPGTREWLGSEISHLDAYVLDALLADETRPRMTRVKEGAILILRGANLNEKADPEDMVSIRLWVEKNRVISVRRRRLMAVGDIEERVQSGRGPRDTGEMICLLMECLFKRIEPVLNTLDETTDDIEEALLESADASLRSAIIDVRKQAIMFRRYMVPQREAIDRMRMADLDWIRENHRRQFQENYNHVTRYIEDLDAVRERAQIVKDELANILSDKLNKNMYMLSVIAAVFLPLGFLTGLLGINVGGIPGSENGDAFWIFSGLLVVMACVQVIVFKWLKWF